MEVPAVVGRAELETLRASHEALRRQVEALVLCLEQKNVLGKGELKGQARAASASPDSRGAASPNAASQRCAAGREDRRPLALANPEKLFAVGGFSNRHDTIGLKAGEYFDAEYGTWQDLPPLNWSRAFHASAVLNRCLYIVGGHFHAVAGSTVRFDTDKWQWETLSSMSKMRSEAAAAASGRFLWVCGGSNGPHVWSCMERFDPKGGKHGKGAWEEMPCMSEKRRSHAMGNVRGELLVCGGLNQGPLQECQGMPALTSAEVFRPAQGKWEAVEPMVHRRCRHAMATNGSMAYVCGGIDSVCGVATAAVECYNLSTGTWVHGAPMMQPRFWHGVGFVAGRLFVVGGFHEEVFPDNPAVCSAEQFDPETGKWTAATAMSTRRTAFTGGVVAFDGVPGQYAAARRTSPRPSALRRPASPTTRQLSETMG